jgi:Icc-related predicted phosphoesterase
MTKIHVLSDTHNKHNELIIPENGADILIHCGDSVTKGNFTEELNFLQWFVKQPYKYKVYVAGNHNRALLRNHRELMSLINEYGIVYLDQSQTKAVDIMGLKIWGGNYTPSIEHPSGILRNPQYQKEAWVNMPANLDILVTHAPPNSILDLTVRGQHIGCELLVDTIKTNKPKIHLFGHCHETGQQSVSVFDTTFYNCANMDRSYLLTYPEPFELIIEV